MYGHTGKILRLNLTKKETSTILTKRYEKWGGGHGIGSAIFWDLVKDKTISGFDARNVVTIMTSPLTGTMALGAGARVEVQGIGVQSYPEWFTRSNFGGRFGPLLKYAGWDGIVIEGKADRPVWIDIRNEQIKIRDAGHLWGKDTQETQQIIWQEINAGKQYGEWFDISTNGKGQNTTQRPAVLTIGPAGENKSRLGCLVHDAGNAAGQGGFGGIWGAKNLKAISVIGTGSVDIADPKKLFHYRNVYKKFYGLIVPSVFWKRPKKSRPQACISCPAGCRSRYASGFGNESSCVESKFYYDYDLRFNSNFFSNSLVSIFEWLNQNHYARFVRLAFTKQSSAAYKAADLLQKYGINAYEVNLGIAYIYDLHKLGVLGPGKEIECDLDFNDLGSYEFAEKFLKIIAYREGLGDQMAEGFYRASKLWGRLEEDLSSGLLEYPYWGLPEHGYDPRAELEWGYGSILGDRDVNEHDFNFLLWIFTLKKMTFRTPKVSADELTRLITDKMVPYEGDQKMLDFSSSNMYSKHIAKLVSWHRHYSRFWKQSVLYCDFVFPDFFRLQMPAKEGITGKGEQEFFNAVTGESYSFLDGMKLGRKIWNLDNAIWTLQGRHRDMVKFADYIYDKPYIGYERKKGLKLYMPGIENGKWEYINLNNRSIDRTRFEEWKTKYYRLEGWDIASGWPSRETLASLGLEHVADELEKNNRLG